MATWSKYKQVIICKLKVSGKDWLLPNIQSRKHQAFFSCIRRRRKGDITILYHFTRVHLLNAESPASSAGLHPQWYLRKCVIFLIFFLFFPSGLSAEVLTGDEALCCFNAVSKYRGTAEESASIPRELTHICTQEATVQGKELAVSSLGTFLLVNSLSFVRSQVLSVSTVWWGMSWVFQCVCACVSTQFQGTLSIITWNSAAVSLSLGFGDSCLCYLQVECVQLQTACICVSLLRVSSFPMCWHSSFVFFQNIVCLDERMLYTLEWG